MWRNRFNLAYRAGPRAALFRHPQHRVHSEVAGTSRGRWSRCPHCGGQDSATRRRIRGPPAGNGSVRFTPGRKSSAMTRWGRLVAKDARAAAGRGAAHASWSAGLRASVQGSGRSFHWPAYLLCSLRLRLAGLASYSSAVRALSALSDISTSDSPRWSGTRRPHSERVALRA